MFWPDEIAQKIKERNLALEWVDDMKTPSGKIHIGSLRGVVIHDLIYKCLLDQKVKSTYTYIFDNHDPMDALPVYLPPEIYEKYLGMPLYKVPSPVEGFDSYAAYYAKDFEKVFNAIGCNPKILWATDLYLSGKMNDAIRVSLDKAKDIKQIYETLYKKELPKVWYPFQPYCPNCGKVSTTSVTNWDGNTISVICEENKVRFTKGCNFQGEMSPFSSQEGIVGKLPWKIEWAAKWKVVGVTVEGAGKDHMTAGGSHSVASIVSEKIFNYPVPFALPYEWFILGKKKMSTSKGVGISAADMLEILPPEVLRFLMVRTKINSEINFDVTNPHTIPAIFDEYQKAAEAFTKKTDEDLARMFSLSQIEEVKLPPSIRFLTLAQLIQAPHMEENIRKENATQWVSYAKVWLERYAPESEKFTVQKELPEAAKALTQTQKAYLHDVASMLESEWEAEKFQFALYEKAKERNISSKEAFAAIYLTFLGKSSGPKAAWLLLSLDKEFVQKRFKELL